MTLTITSPHQPVSLLILGAGWLSQFLYPLLSSHNITHIGTTRNGRLAYGHPTIAFDFDPNSKDRQQYERLPDAKTVLVTFPVLGRKGMQRLVRLYEGTHKGDNELRAEGGGRQWILLGSTGIWGDRQGEGGVVDRHSDADKQDERWAAEQEILNHYDGTVMNLAGLWGESQRDRVIWNYLERWDKKTLKEKKAVFWVHGRDVARGVLGLHDKFKEGERWLVSDGTVYDWWTVFWENGPRLEKIRDEQGKGKMNYRDWILEFMRKEEVRYLPRTGENVGRRLDAREFWEWIGTPALEERFGMQNLTQEGGKVETASPGTERGKI